MPPLLYLLLNGLALGLGAAAPIGPVNVEIARRTIRFGRAAGFLLGCGAVTIDVGYAIVTSLTFLPVLRYPRVTAALSVAGGIFLGYLAWACLKSAWRVHESIEGIPPTPNGSENPQSRRATPCGPPGEPDTPIDPRWRHYVTGLLMTALNPMTLGFWFVAVPGAVARLTTRPRVDLPVVCAGVFLGAFGWVCGFTAIVGHLKKFGGQRWLRWIDLAGGLMLLAFAIRAIWRVAGSSL